MAVDISDFADDFNDGVINSTYWPVLADFWLGPEYVTETNGSLQFRGHHADRGYIGLFFNWFTGQGTQWDVSFPYDGPTIDLVADCTAMRIRVVMSQSSIEVTMTNNGDSQDPGAPGEERTDIAHGAFSKFRITRNQYFTDGGLTQADTDWMFVEGLPVGSTTWQLISQLGNYGQGSLNDPWQIAVELYGDIDMNDVRGITVPINTGTSILKVRANDTWYGQVGEYFFPLGVRDGSTWRIYAGGPGPGKLKVRASNGTWVVVASEGYQYARLRGHVTSSGIPAANRGIYYHQDFPVGTIVETGSTDAVGNYDEQFLPFNRDIYVRVFLFANNFNTANSTVRGPIRFTQATRLQTLNIGF